MKHKNGSLEINFYCLYYEALHKKHTGEEPVSTDFTLACMDMEIINADEGLSKMYKTLSAKFAAMTRKDANRKTSHLQVQPSPSGTSSNKQSPSALRLQVKVGTGPLNKDPCFFCSSKGYECREATQEQLNKDRRNLDKCHVCIHRTGGRCNANRASELTATAFWTHCFLLSTCSHACIYQKCQGLQPITKVLSWSCITRSWRSTATRTISVRGRRPTLNFALSR